MTPITISDYQWQTFAQGDKVFAKPVNPFCPYDDLPKHDGFENAKELGLHTYEALNIAPGLTIDGRDLELVEESLYKDKWITGAYSNCQRRFTIHLKTHTVEDKKTIDPTNILKGKLLAFIYSNPLPRTQIDLMKFSEVILSLYDPETIVQETLKYVAESNKLIAYPALKQRILSLQPEIIKIIKEKVK